MLLLNETYYFLKRVPYDLKDYYSVKRYFIRSATRIRKDKSVIEKYTAFYVFTKTDEGWKIYAISSVILD